MNIIGYTKKLICIQLKKFNVGWITKTLKYFTTQDDLRAPQSTAIQMTIKPNQPLSNTL